VSTATPDQQAQSAIRHVLGGEAPNGITPDDCGGWADVVRGLYDAHAAGGAGAVRRAFDAVQRLTPGLAVLVAGDGPKPPRYLLHTAVEALQPQPPVPWIIDGLLSAGSVALVVGAPGSAKTYSLLDAAVCVAQGAPWLTCATRQAPVLVVDEESGPRRMARRLGDVLRGHSAGPETPVFYTSLARFDLRKAGDLAALADAVDETGARLVIVDALVDTMPGGDENAVADVHPVFMALRGIAETTGAAIVVIHHTNKAGGYRGSSAMHGAVDVMILVKKEGDGLTFDMSKNRDGEPGRFAAVGYWEEGRFWLSPVTPSAEKRVYPVSERYVLRWLSEHGASTTPDIAQHADSCSERAATLAVYRLADRGLVHRVDGGSAGTVATYALTEAGQEAASANL
jgi:hypothetical protein